MIPVKDGLYDGVLRVLLLEDSETDAELIRFALQDAIPGLLLKRVDTRDDFERAIKDFSPQVVLSDYVVPGFDGLSALKLFRNIHPDLPFLFVTGALGEELAVDLLRAGATDYILKDRMSRLPSAVFRALEELREKELLARRTIELQEKTRELAEEVADRPRLVRRRPGGECLA
jgi:DNA-binding NtrC family response regulator